MGGVAANSRLRSRLDAEWKQQGLARAPLFPNFKYCTDNAAMIAAAGLRRWAAGDRGGVLDFNAEPGLTL